MTRRVSLYDAKSQLSALVEAAAGGDEIVICKNGVPKAKLVAFPQRLAPRQPAGALKITRIADDFDAPDPEVIKLFGGG
jgi:prevent-host-death family protein